MDSESSPGSPDAEEEQDIEAEVAAIDSQRFPAPTPAIVEKCRTLSKEQVREIDTSIVERGMHLFFNNHFKEAEQLFQERYRDDPLIATAFGTLGAIRALLSFEGDDIDEASNRLVYANAFASRVSPKGTGLVGAIRAVGSWFGRAKPKELMSHTEFRALICMGEAELLRANVILLKDSISAYLKAGLALRRGYNIYNRLQKYVQEHPEEHGADANSLGGMHFGLGAIHVTTSILPPRILALLKALGYMHDRNVGFHHLQRCLDTNTLRSPVASLFMLVFHGMLPSFAPLMVKHSVPKAEGVIRQTLSVFPRSVIHMWLAGRVARLNRNVESAVSTFEDCVSYGDGMKEELPQLKHFAQYDLAFTLCSCRRWSDAAAQLRALEQESNWSRMFYAYAQGCIAELVGDFDTARQCFERSASYPSIKIAGKVISIEQFVRRRLPVIASNGYLTLDMAFMERKGLEIISASTIELLMHFNVFTQMPKSELGELLTMLQRSVQAHERYFEALFAEGTAADDPTQTLQRMQAAVEWSAVLTLASANVLRELGEFSQANSRYEALHNDTFLPPLLAQLVAQNQIKSPSKRKRGVASGVVELVEETWIKPYALYENGVSRYREAERCSGEPEADVTRLQLEGRALFDKVTKLYKGKDFSFEMQLAFRLHLTNDALKQAEA